MNIQIVTTEDLERAKQDIINTMREEMTNLGNHNSEDDYLTSKQVQEELGISSRQFQKYRDQRRIAFSQFGRKIYVKRSDLNKFIESHRIPTRDEKIKPEIIKKQN